MNSSLPSVQRVHASCVAVEGRGALITGRSGAGKSQLAMKMIGLGAELIADDQVELHFDPDRIALRPPVALAGLIEVRGMGIVRLAHAMSAELVLVVDMDTAHEARFPHLRNTYFTNLWFPLIAGRGRPNLAYEVMACLRSGLDPLFLDPEDMGNGPVD
ncbi:MAG: serine kinase [Pseudomonadota bacterium]